MKGRSLFPRDNLIRFLLFLNLFFLMSLAYWDRIVKPEPWLDDGPVLFADSLCKGINSIFDRYAGAFLVAQRLLAILLLQISPENIFALYSIATFLIISWILSRFCLSCYSWLVPSQGLRILTVLLMAFGQGTREVESILTTLGYPFATYFLFTILENKLRISTFKYIILTLLALSSQAAGSLIFLAGLFYFYKRQKEYLHISLICLFSLTIHIFFSFFTDYSGVAPSTTSIELILYSLFDRMFTYGIMVPIFGYDLSRFIAANTILYLITAVLCSSFLYLIIYKKYFINFEQKLRIAILGMIASMLFFNLMHLLARNYSFSPSYANILLIWRVTFLLNQVSLIIFFIFFSRIAKAGIKSIALLMFVIIQNILIFRYMHAETIGSCPAASLRFTNELSHIMLNPPADSVQIKLPPLLIGPVKSSDGINCSDKDAGSILNVELKNGIFYCNWIY